MIRNIKGDKATSKKALRALQKMDANKDGNIDKKEFVSVMLKKMSKMNPSQFSAKCAQIQRGRRDLNIESVFHMWDQNGNGTLDVREFARMVKTDVDYALDSAKIMKKFALLDKNADKQISLEEYRNYMMMIMGAMDDKHFYRAIRALKKAAFKMWTEKKSRT